MSEVPKESGAPLQFDTAEFAGGAPAALSCAVCKQPINWNYYQVNGHVVCAQCRTQLEKAQSTRAEDARYPQAFLLGLGAAAIGAIAWTAITLATNVQIGLVAIGVGWLVAKAVRKGAGGRGGRPYQVMAVALTYLAVVSFYGYAILANAGLELTGPLLLQSMVLAAKAPFTAGGVLGLVIIGFALFQAWQGTQGTPLQITGPFKVGSEPRESTGG